jgi:hypothetical protein
MGEEATLNEMSIYIMGEEVTLNEMSMSSVVITTCIDTLFYKLFSNRSLIIKYNTMH